MCSLEEQAIIPSFVTYKYKKNNFLLLCKIENQ
jgi:hypothetical protein